MGIIQIELFTTLDLVGQSPGGPELSPDLSSAIGEIRDRHQHVTVVGSLNLVQTLLSKRLFDRLDLWVHPILLGSGKRIFDARRVPANLRLIDPPVASPNGTVLLRYELADGVPATGDMSQP